MRGRDKFNKIKPIMILLSKTLRLLPMSFRDWLFIKVRMCKGNIGIAIRYIILKSIVYDCGDNISIHPGVYLLNIKNIKIGNNVSIHPMCYIDSTGGIIIGNDVSIAHSTTIMSTEHLYNNLNINIKDQGVVYKKTIINDNVWMGSGVRLLAGNEVKFGSILAAGTVVTKDVEENVIVAGVPAKIIKYRNKN